MGWSTAVGRSVFPEQSVERMQDLSVRVERTSYSNADCFDVVGIVIRVARPEEAPQTILRATGNHMDVEMRDALTDRVVGCHKRPRCLHSGANGSGGPLNYLEQGPQQLAGQILDCFVMVSGDDQYVAGEQRPVIEEGDRRICLEHDRRRMLAGDDLAKDAGVHAGHASGGLRADGMREITFVISFVDMKKDWALRRALGVVVALTLAVGAMGPSVLAQTVTTDDVAAAEAEEADAAAKLDEARRDLADAEATRDKMTFALASLEAREEDVDVTAASEAVAVRHRLTRMYMVAGRPDVLLLAVGEVGKFFTRLAYLGAIANRDREAVNRFTLLIEDLVELQGQAESELVDLASRVGALELVMASRSAALDEATVEVNAARQRWAEQEAARKAALAAEIARQEAAIAAAAAAASSGSTTTPPFVNDPGEHVYDPSGGVEQWRPLVTSIFARWGLTQEKCGPAGCLGPHVGDALTIMWCESRGVPFAVNPASSTTGLFQHRPTFWPDRTARVRNHAESGGVFPSNATPYNPAHNIEVAALLIWESRETLIGNLSWGGPWDDGPQPFGHWDSTSRYCADPPLVWP